MNNLFFKNGSVSIVFFIFINQLIKLSNSSILKIYNEPNEIITESSNYTLYSISTPPFALGNLSFPITGRAVFGNGCKAFQKINQSELLLSNNNNNNDSNIIFFIEYGTTDHSCFSHDSIFGCQETNWCSAVLRESRFYSPCGYEVWSVFNKRRPRNDYKRPLVDAQNSDFMFFKKLILESQAKNQSHVVILTNDPNPWEEIFSGVGYFIYFRIINPIWSFGCLVLIFKILQNQYQRESLVINNNNDNNRKISKCCNFSFRRLFILKPSLKRICLVLHAITHFCRIALWIDAFASQQIYTFLESNLLICASIVFEISTNMLLSFVIRELTQARTTINVFQKLRYHYIVIIIFIIIDFVNSALEGQKLNIQQFPFFWIVVFFYVVVDLVLGFWFLYQGIQFLKKCKRLKNENIERIILTQTSIFNSIMLILFALVAILLSIAQVFATPLGYVLVFSFLTAIVQVTSLSEILLFGGVVFNINKLKSLLC